MRNWSTARVSELIDRKVIEIGDGYRAKNSELGASGLPFVRAGNIENGIKVQGADHLLIERLPYAKGKTSRANDVVFTSKGTVGRIALVPDGMAEFVYSPQLCFWRVLDRSVLDPRFIYYWFVSPDGQAQLAALKDQTDMAPYVSLRDQRTIRITFPSTHTQRKISEVLGALDEKIDLNRRTSATAEQLSRAYFANAAASAPYGVVSDLVELVVERASGAENSDKYVGLEDMPSWSIDLGTHRSGNEVTSSIVRFRKGDILFGAMRPYFAKVGLAQFDGITRTTTFVLRPQSAHSRIPALLWLASPEAIDYATSASVGSTIPYVRWEALAAMRAPLLDGTLIARLTAVVGPLLELIETNARENRVLAQLRDALLPELISGRMTVN